jgi:hypothetical protein
MKVKTMPLIQVRDVPDHIYRLLAEQAERERRSLAQQVVAVLARGLHVEVDAKARRRALLEALRASPPVRTSKLSGPAKLIREDRRR